MTKRERFKLSVSVFLILKKENQILLLKRSNTGWMDGYFSIPAGALDGDETLSDAIIREAKEEVSVDVLKNDLTLVHTIHCFINGEEWLGQFFLAEKWGGNIKVNEPDKHSEVKWVDVNNLPENTIRLRLEDRLRFQVFGF
jgi:ADP-ribose pyrophosphatase YjhB (NUDIX family)